MNTPKKPYKNSYFSYFVYIFIICLTPQASAMLYNWEQPFQKSISLEGHEAEIIIIQLSPDESFVLTTDMNGVAKIWDTNLGIVLQTFKTSNQAPILCSTISTDGATIALFHENNSINLWDATTGSLLKTISCRDASPVMLMHFNFLTLENVSVPCLITCAQNKTITCYNTLTGEIAHTFDEGKNKDSYGLDINFKNNTVILSDNTIDLYDLVSKKIIKTFPGQYEKPTFGSTKNLLALYTQNKIGIWDTPSSKLIMETDTLQPSNNQILDIIFNHDNRYLICYYFTTPNITIWDVEKNRLVSTLKNNDYNFLELSPDGHYGILGVPGKKAVAMRHISTQAVVKKFNCCAKSLWFKGLAMSPSGKFLAVVSDTLKAEIHFFHKKFFECATQSRFKKLSDTFIHFA